MLSVPASVSITAAVTFYAAFGLSNLGLPHLGLFDDDAGPSCRGESKS
jgi:hypothetical protein